MASIIIGSAGESKHKVTLHFECVSPPDEGDGPLREDSFHFRMGIGDDKTLEGVCSVLKRMMSASLRPGATFLWAGWDIE
jgi:hypothetical protein